MSYTFTDLTNHFLIAMPGMNDPNFFQAVIYICEYNENGALGIVINHPTTIGLGEILRQMNIKYINPEMDHYPVLYGGPVHQERGFVIHKPFGTWRSSFAVDKDIVVTTSSDVLEAIAAKQGPKDAIITLGYAGWGEGQLEAELAQNIWLCSPATSVVLFEIPFEKRWHAAASSIGVDLNSISGDAGHA